MTIWNEDKQISNAERYMLEHSNLPEYQWLEDELKPDVCDVDAYKRLNHIRVDIKNFVRSRNNNLLICGNSLGCGKTSWALKLLLTFFEENVSKFDGIDEKDIDRGVLDIGVFVQTAPFLVKMKQFGGNDEAYKLYKRLEKTELAVFDDIAAVKMSSYDYNILYALIETRVFSHLPSIFTSNITSENEMRTILGPRLADRVWNNSVAIELKGHGYRFR